MDRKPDYQIHRSTQSVSPLSFEAPQHHVRQPMIDSFEVQSPPIQEKDAFDLSYAPTHLTSTPARSRWSLTWWWKEITAVIASFFFQGAAVVILLRMSGKPLDAWTFFIAINATIAIFTTAAKAALLLSVTACIGQWKWLHFKSRPAPIRDMDVYDEASRGSLGSLLLLFRVRWGIPTFGALVTILTLAIDAFSQQVVAFDTLPVPFDSGTAAFAFSHDYISGARSGGFADGWNATMSTADYAMQASVYRGIFNLDQTPLFTCPSTCAWEGSFASVGFVSTCKNVTQATSKTKKCGRSSNPSELTVFCNMTTPGGVLIGTVFNPTNVQTILSVNAARTILPSSNYTYIKANFSRIAIFKAPSVFNGAATGIEGEEITECDISLALIRYSDVSAAGSNLTIGSQESVALDVGHFDNRTETFAFNHTRYPDVSNFNVSITDLGTLMSFFEAPSFSGNLYDGNYDRTLDGNAANSLGVAGAFLNGSVPEIMDRMASSMTNHVRLGPNMQRAFGTTTQPVVFVRVDWKWLSLPVFAEVAAAVLLVATMKQSRRSRNVGLWKSSNVALLYHYVTHPDGILRSDVQTPAELRELASSVKAKLQ